jgi:hypothetical protein
VLKVMAAKVSLLGKMALVQELSAEFPPDPNVSTEALEHLISDAIFTFTQDIHFAHHP